MLSENTESKDLNIFKSLNEILTEIWANDSSRPWDHYFKGKKFRYHWDIRTVEHRK